MRLKEVSNNWRASGVIHKDNRHDHSDGVQHLKNRRDKRKWCRGKRGVEHQIVRYIEKGFKELGWLCPDRMYGKCINCGRVFYGKSWKRKTHLPLIIRVDCEPSHFEVSIRWG